MDAISHILTNLFIGKQLDLAVDDFLILGFTSVMPDVGELMIQRELKKITGQSFNYNSNTDNKLIAQDLKTTFLYDIMHSPPFWLTFYLMNLVFISSSLITLICFSALIHILLDLATHGKIWALKLLFPISNKRFPILSKQLGNWWDWQPKILIIKKFKIPSQCLVYWSVILILFIVIS